ncbi:unnamed protein product [Rotaria magnacalcarata]|uniref:Phytanoyl-CoA dioxygenase n=4 Tax=Rotaria magnacalcarata TaxID=392030 RepID=A0A814JCV1_9BILA|nr:unnamed protein product [Rotaria magnacalcarata]CAF1629234.1 unnamed protein product [Rotaria magnacalcarata]CAF2102525.1 unnamed protein product [Rotaria magnacalcarata]CAF2218011.1 unnamed protein product [Rotaria magnacalcarata]CAF3850248.1 unnamed protein product [Rotaria magnacalcarata]
MLPATKVTVARVSATSPTAEFDIIKHIERDGVVIVTGMFSRDHIEQVKKDLAPYFDSDTPDQSGFFPTTTQRANHVFGISRACIDMCMHPLLLAVGDRLLTSTYHYYRGLEKCTAVSKPIISATNSFRINPGGRQQALHRDDEDYHARPCDQPMMISCVIAITRTHRDNGATIVIPGSHLWKDENRPPLVEEAIPAELEPGDATIFLGNLYHAGGENKTKDEKREVFGVFLMKAFYRQAENEYLMIPPERCKELKMTPKELRMLGYGISQPSCGGVNYKDPMESVFGIIDKETVRM